MIMASMDELNSAARLRESVTLIATETFETLNPPPRHATVMSIDTSAGKVGVTYPDEAGVFTIKSEVVMPSVGSIVRVAGKMGARYVDFQLSGGITVNGTIATTGLYGLELRNDQPTITFRDTNANTAFIHVNGNTFYILRAGNDAVAPNWTQVGGVWPLMIDLTTNAMTIGGALTVTGGINSTLQLNREGGANEGGQLRFQGGTSFGNDLYLDRFNNDIRMVYNGGVPIQFNADGWVNGAGFRTAQLDIGYWSGNNAYSGMFHRSGGANNYIIMANTGETIVGSPVSGGSVSLRAGLNNTGAQLAINNNGIHIMTGSLQTSGYLYSNAAVYSTSAYVWRDDQDSGLFFSSDGVWDMRRNGTVFANVHPQYGMLVHNTSANNEYQYQAMILRGDSSSNCAIGFETVNNIFQLRNYGAIGRIDCVNYLANGYITFGADGYFTASSIVGKKDVEVADDDDVLGKAFWTQGKTYHRKADHLVSRPTERFLDIDGRWTAKGHTPLTLTHEHRENAVHDCSIDNCDGTAESPCQAERNHSARRRGLIAEEVFELFPECVSVDGDGSPEGLFVEAVAGTALAGVGALTRKLTEAFLVIEDLQARLAVLESN